MAGLTEAQAKQVAIALHNVPFDESKGKDGLDHAAAQEVKALAK